MAAVHESWLRTAGGVVNAKVLLRRCAAAAKRADWTRAEPCRATPDRTKLTFAHHQKRSSGLKEWPARCAGFRLLRSRFAAPIGPTIPCRTAA